QAGFAHRVGRRSMAARPQASDTEVNEHRNLGVAFYRTGILDEATREFRRVLELRPGDPSARFHLALIAIRQGHDRDAIRQLRSPLEETGANAAALLDLAYALGRIGRTADAILVLDEVESLRPGRADVAFARGVITLESGDANAAATAFET